MITKEHQLELINKRSFASRVSAAVAGQCGSITEVRYEAYIHKTKDWLQEWLIVTYRGGAIAVRSQDMNSHSAMLRDIGKLADGGYYDEVKAYHEMVSSPDWEKIV